MQNAKCGFVMPISGFDQYSSEYWAELKLLLCRTLDQLELGPAEIVSNSLVDPDIKSSIFNNLFTLPIVIVVVSGNNPNVLFELGIRVGLDMPIIIIKDDKTKFNFDLNSFYTIEYPVDVVSLPESNGKRIKFCHELKSRLSSQLYAFYSKSEFISPLKKYLTDSNYLQVKRGVPFNIEGYFEYKCHRDEIGYRHGGWCNIRLMNLRGNVMEWELDGRRCWLKPNNDEPIQEFENPFRWKTSKAVIFADRYFMLSYTIITPLRHIVGIIKGEVDLQKDGTTADSFIGYYHQDEGEQVIKGRFTMKRVATDVTVPDYCFIYKK